MLSVSRTVRGREITVTATPSIKGIKLVYNGLAVDHASGISVASKHWKSQGGAQKHAIEDLFVALAPILENERKVKEAQETKEREMDALAENAIADEEKAIAELGVPLPPGWELKYDHKKKKVFYIDTVFKRTSWERPEIRTNLGSTKQAGPRIVETNLDDEKYAEPVELKQSDKPRYFISYKQSESGALAQCLYNGLKGKGGAWLDTWNETGQSISDMRRGIKNCEVFLLVLSKGYFDSRFCVLELKYAIKLKKDAIMVYNTDNMAKSDIGGQLAKAKEAGIELADWPSALQINSDGNLFNAMLENVLRAEPMKLRKILKMERL